MSYLMTGMKKEFFANLFGVAKRKLFLPDLDSYLFKHGVTPLGFNLATFSMSTKSNENFLSYSLLIL